MLANIKFGEENETKALMENILKDNKYLYLISEKLEKVSLIIKYYTNKKYSVSKMCEEAHLFFTFIV